MDNSGAYFKRTGRRYLYNIMPLSNIPSVMNNGILCYEFAAKIYHQSIAMNDVQKRRSTVKVPNGLWLHEYANLYFTYHNPMMFSRKDRANEFCILAIASEVLDIDGCVLADRNAASSLVRFSDPLTGIGLIDFEKVFAKYWTNYTNQSEVRNHKQIKCAEILVPYKVGYNYIIGAIAVNDGVEERLRAVGFDKPIQIRPSAFYR